MRMCYKFQNVATKIGTVSPISTKFRNLKLTLINSRNIERDSPKSTLLQLPPHSATINRKPRAVKTVEWLGVVGVSTMEHEYSRLHVIPNQSKLITMHETGGKRGWSDRNRPGHKDPDPLFH
ncbi:hypothetical protein K0M31_018694 [Melipona bicolor]|uniref:Uncharacterized protein n=1 Tax=Melipona bicolor TaxID=60889 RepID=A0AA40KRX8_9HYME|nr:hypothetical protein K0M31_018694 [Melipona bicolor]